MSIRGVSLGRRILNRRVSSAEASAGEALEVANFNLAEAAVVVEVAVVAAVGLPQLPWEQQWIV